MTAPSLRRCTIHHATGGRRVSAIERDAEPSEVPYRTAVADRVPLRDIMPDQLICALADLEIAAVVRTMMDHRLGCLPVVDEQRRPIGVITKLDLVEQLDAGMRAASIDCALPADLAARTAEDVMTPHVLTLEQGATITRAAELMMTEDTHHVLAVSRSGALVGVVSSKDIVGWVLAHGSLAVRRDASCGPAMWHPLEG